MSEQKDKINLLLAILIVAVVLVGAVVWAVTRKQGQQPESGHQHQKEPETVARLRAEREAIAAEPKATFEDGPTLEQIVNSAQTWLSVLPQWRGQIAPDFVLTGIDDKEYKLSDHRGKNVLLIFWATWCPPCRTEIPELILLRKRFSQDKLAILAVTNEKADHVKDFVKRVRINYTVLLDTGKMPAPFGVERIYATTGLPSAFFIDSEGEIKLATAGAVSMAETKAILRAKK